MNPWIAALLGAMGGALGMWIALDREGLRDRLTSITDHAPSGEQAADRGKAILAFAAKNWMVVLVIAVLLIWGISSLVQQANQVPQVHLGLNQFTDKCGQSVTVDLTVEDVHRGYFTLGSTPECRRIVNLSPGPTQDKER